MAAGNTIILTGNITRDPELRWTRGGSAVASFGLAVNRRWQQDGEWQEETDFFNVTAWRDLAENLAESVQKGDRVVIEGRMKFSEYEDRDGNARSGLEVIADDVGASMRWATVEVTKNERKDRDGNSSSRGGGRRGGGDGGGRRGSGGGRRGQSAEPAYDPAEEPF